MLNSQQVDGYYIGKIYAWRHFTVRFPKGRLNINAPSQAFNFEVENRALCGDNESAWVHKTGNRSYLSCQCGFYCYKTLADAIRFSDHKDHTPGLVSITGIIVECDNGYRASSMKIEALFLPRFTAPKFRKRIEEESRIKIYAFGDYIDSVKFTNKASKLGLPCLLTADNPITEIPQREWIT